MRYIGIDLSLSATGIYDNLNNYKRIQSNPDKKIEDRIIDIADEILNFINLNYNNQEQKILCGIEGFSFCSKGMAIYQLAGLGYYIRIMLHKNKIRYYDISPLTWKKFLFKDKVPVGVKKDIIILKTYKNYNIEILDNNLCDAFNIMKFIEAVDKYKINPLYDNKLTEAQKKCLEKFIL